MNTSGYLIDSFKPQKISSLASCKKKSTLILENLKLCKQDVVFDDLEDRVLLKKADIDYIFCSYHTVVYFARKFDEYKKAKNINPNEKLTRSKILEFIAFSDGFPTWENMQHHLSSSKVINNTFLLKYDKSKFSDLAGPCKVYVYFDDKNHELNGTELFNPSKVLDNQLPIGYSWGYSGSSALELSRALLYAINPKLVKYSRALTEGLLHHIPQEKPYTFLTSLEIISFIEHFEANPDSILKPPLESQKVYDLEDFIFNIPNKEHLDPA